MSFNKVKTLFLVSILFSLCCFLPNITYADTLDTKLSRDQIALGETVTVSFNLNSSSTDRPPDFSPFEKDFRILGTNYGTAINVLNGVTQAQTFWQVTLEPKRAGELLIPEINFGNVKSPSRKLLVKEASAVIQSDQQNTSAFVKAELNITSPYVQSQVLYTFKLFYRSQLENPRMEPPHIKDAMLLQIGEDKFYQTTIKGDQFYVFEKNFAIFPQKIGKLTIPPTHFRALQFDINSGLMNNPFSITTNKLVTLATKSFTLDVQKVPDNFHGKSWLPAKNISLTEKWSSDPNQWEIGNPITRTITVEAQGLRADQIPDLSVDNISGVNIYADPPHRSNSLQGNSVLGTLQQKITYIPNRSQSFTIPALRLDWWNTQTNANAIAQLKSIAVQVQEKTNNVGSTSSGATPIARKVEETKQATDLLSQNPAPAIVQQKKTTTNQTTLFYLSIWFWIAIFLLMIWLITLWWGWKNTVAKKALLNAFAAKVNRSGANTRQLSDKTFSQACEEGDAVLAQKFLLSWAKTHWQEPPRNLRKLCEMINDENFKKALENLEQALYADEVIQWNGQALLAAYQNVRKNRKQSCSTPVKGKRIAKDRPLDPLPPLHP